MLKKLYDFISEAETKGWNVKGPKDLPKNFLVHSKYFYIRNLLNEKFNLKLTTDDVILLLEEENIPEFI